MIKSAISLSLALGACCLEPINHPPPKITITEWCSDFGCEYPSLPTCDADGFCTCDARVCYEPTCEELLCSHHENCNDYGDNICVCDDNGIQLRGCQER